MCELWIRTQKREDMFKVNNLQTLGGVIYTYLNDDGNYTLGEYETPRRAKEVLDEIQNLLQPRIIVNGELDSEQENALCYFLSSKNVGKVMPRSIVDMNCIPLDTIVYKMPEK